MFIVNAGYGFKILWKIVKGWLDPKTTAKIHVRDNTYEWPLFPQMCGNGHIHFLYAQVLGNKYQSRLLEAIDARYVFANTYVVDDLPFHCIVAYRVMDRSFIFLVILSQLPDFLGGLCTCSDEGGCLRSNRGPWNDPVIMKV